MIRKSIQVIAMTYKGAYITIEHLYDLIIESRDFKYDHVQGTRAEHKLLTEYGMYKASLRPPILGGTGMPTPRPNPLTHVHRLASSYAKAIRDVADSCLTSQNSMRP